MQMAAPFAAKKGRKRLPVVGDCQLTILGRPTCCWWQRWQRRHDERRGTKWLAKKKRKNLGRKTNFSPALSSHFFSLKVWNPPLFIGGRRWTLCLFWKQILTLDLNRKDLSHQFKVAIIDYQILTTQGCLSWLFQGDVEADMILIGQKEPYRGMVECQAIIFMQVLSNLVDR